jgi:thioredoxin 1
LLLILVSGWLLLGLLLSAAAQNPPGQPVLPEILEFDRKFCPVCKESEQIIQSVRVLYPEQFAVRRMYIDEEEQAFRRYRVAIVPTQVFLDADGKEVFRH